MGFKLSDAWIYKFNFFGKLFLAKFSAMAVVKGKQGTKGAKQIKEENAKTFKFYCYIMATANIFAILFQIVPNIADLQWKIIILFIFSLVIYLLCVKMMSSMVSNGLDLNMEAGMAEHMKDILIVTAVCQVTSCYSMYFWLLWLVVPAVAFQKLWVNILSPWIFQEPTELTEKQKKKMEKNRRQQR